MTKTIEPTVWTTRGNYPLAELDFEHYFIDESDFTIIPAYDAKGQKLTFMADKQGKVTCVLIYRYKDDGQIASESRHMYLFKGLPMRAEQGRLA